MQKLVVLSGLLLAMPGESLLAQDATAAQRKEPFSYVDPFIGTTISDVRTKWGNEGGTYPGAVAPWGYMQLSPETKEGRGYDYADSTICYFSCAHHLSGYPNGSAGEVKVMPVRINGEGTEGYSRPFVHGDEGARPGYYRVRFRDDGTLMEATASVRVGLYRMTFPAGVTPQLYIGGIGKISCQSNFALRGDGLPAALLFSRPFVGEGEPMKGGKLLRFSPSAKGPTIIVLAISVSPSGLADAERRLGGVINGERALSPTVFDRVRQETEEAWRKNLAVVEIDDDREELKKIFYTALYHSMLLPWIISDADGNYRGTDGVVRRSAGKNQYGTFSFWDTFRTLHPLLTLLYPDRQQDMILSMLDIYRQSGNLPAGPMTGDHAIPVIVDSWLKGIRGFDSSLAYEAMCKGVLDEPFVNKDRSIYQELGYIPLSYPESVTRTVEYAYDDWCLSQFAGKVMHRPAESALLARRGYSYRNLFDPELLFLLPRDEGGKDGRAVFRKRPGTSGYKEGDPWVYSYFVPHHPDDLVNLMGGDDYFTSRLGGALTEGDIVFDNETVFHLPYLFNYSGRPDKTQQWVSAIRDYRFAARPGGLPGNDDMGSMSSWYVFSALGLFPLCPGKPFYDIGTPLFRSVTLHLAKGGRFDISAPRVGRDNKYVRSLRVNGRSYDSLFLSHELITQGGRMEFDMGAEERRADAGKFPGAGEKPDFSIYGLSVPKRSVRPHELFRVRFALHNKGGMRTKILTLEANGQVVGRQNYLVGAGATIIDSVDCRLYAFGKVGLTIQGAGESVEVEVVRSGDEANDGTAQVEITEFAVTPLLKKGEKLSISCKVRNIGGERKIFSIPIRINHTIVVTDSVQLEPGESRRVSRVLTVGTEELQEIGVMKLAEKFKVYGDRRGSLLLDLSIDSLGGGSMVRDRSGFENQGRLIGRTGRIEIDHSPSLDRLGETITMMARVYPVAPGEGLVDIFSKGDNHVLQVAGNSGLTFFAGGWGRGDCTVPLPADWFGHWHTIAGVCTGPELRVYIDGVLQGTAKVAGRVNLSVDNKWVLGGNEEFPGQRAFNGYIGRAQIFAEPLSGEEILIISSRR